jgi:hypothetical protein
MEQSLSFVAISPTEHELGMDGLRQGSQFRP